MPDPDQRRGRGSGSWTCADASVAGRTGSAPSSASRPGPCRGSCAATRCRYLRELRPDHRGGDPGLEGHRGPLRTRPARRAGPHGRQEARPDPRRRRLARPRPRSMGTTAARQTHHGRVTTTSTPWSTTTPGWPTPRSCPTRRAPPARRSSTRAAAYFAAHGITRIERVMTDNAWAYRYSLREVVRRARHPPEVHQAPLPLAERQGRTPQPHPADRVGLPAGLHQQRPNEPPPLRPGSSTTTLNAATAHSEDYPPISRLPPT